MGGVCQDNSGQWFVWHTPYTNITQEFLVSFDNPHSNVTTNDLELGTLLAQIHLFALSIPPLTHVCTYVDNTAA